jgi:hypothetical protein
VLLCLLQFCPVLVKLQIGRDHLSSCTLNGVCSSSLIPSQSVLRTSFKIVYKTNSPHN